ncbi:G2 M phase checkpoint control protein [Rutstroemia sp. NJR-2017a WRK4]|nr:G2 M phase checkpoint control protein [Rutstroemia sp. NJR-2017a WRK4]
MSEFIGYVGTLHEINSENSTVALENVKSYGTEGRKENADEEIPPSDSTYEYIVFRGSDVKDLRIEEAPAPKENKPPQVPNDPAILGSGSRPTPASQAPPAASQNQRGPPAPGQGPQQQGPPPPGVSPFGQYPPPFYPPPPAGWGRGGPPGPGFPGMAPYGAPPGWYPPPGFPQHPGAFPPYGYPPGPPGQQFPPNQQNQQSKPSPIGAGANKQQSPPSAGPSDKPAGSQEKPKAAAESATAGAQDPKQSTPSAAKPSPTEIEANPAQLAPPAGRAAPSGPKSGRIQPAVPLASPATAKIALNNAPTAPGAQKQVEPPASLRDATQAATAAVAAAMAKLPPVGGQQSNGNTVDNLTRKVNELRTGDPVRGPRQPGANGFAQRGRGRGGRPSGPAKVEVPATDFDFESANAKFSKEDLVKEAIAGSPLGEQAPESDANKSDVSNTVYNKATSFFDNISSEAKDRTESAGNRQGGKEWRGEEQKKNVETFGQGSVDNGYRGGYRGRGRGRGGYRGRGNFGGNGQPTRGRGGYRGRGDAQAAIQ